MRKRLLLCVALLTSRVSFAACPIERAPVRMGNDADALFVFRMPVATSIASLHAFPRVRPLPHDARVAPAEMMVHSVTATLIRYRRTSGDEIELVLADEDGRTITATIPPYACAMESEFLTGITAARTAFEQRYDATETFTEVRHPVEVQGVGFFEFLQGQPGLAPNGLSLNPVVSIDFRPYAPAPPPVQVGRRRSVAGRLCTRPALTITPAHDRVCAGEAVTLDWNASDPAARVTIDGIGDALPGSGSVVATNLADTIYSGRAITACGEGDEAVALVTVTPPVSAWLSGPSSMTEGESAALNISVAPPATWFLTSVAGNPISQLSGNSSATVSYQARRPGHDTIMLTSNACGGLLREWGVTIASAPVDPPDTPAPSFIKCCDGSFSPKCTSCTQGCCSGHGGCKDCSN